MTVQALDRRLYLRFHIDANRINARGRLENMNRLQAWSDLRIIVIHMSGTARAEAMAGGSRQRSRRANSYLFTIPTMLNADEENRWRAIEAVLFPSGARTESDRNDVEIVFQAWKWDANLVTDDGGSGRQPGGILGNRDRLARLDVRVMSDAEAVDQPWGHQTVFGSLRAVPPGPFADTPPVLAPALSVHCSLLDWGKYARLHLAAARGDAKLLKLDTFKRLHADERKQGYALGWVVTQATGANGVVMRHAGSNGRWYARITILPQRNLAILVATNRDSSKGVEAAHDALVRRFAK